MKDEIINYLKTLRDSIIASFETLEPKKKFVRTPWKHPGGGGEMSVIRGEHFEKAAVNWSAVSGENLPTNEAEGPFFATGVSLITHMLNPHAPTAHMNVRYIETKNSFWFGGGYDLTPMGFPYEEDTCHFHSIAQKTLAPFGAHLYPTFAKQAKEYFYIPHRTKERGVGGIFFDHYNTGNLQNDLSLWKAVGSTFIDAVMPLYRKRISQQFTEQDKETQLKMRAHYVEFNLLYDRGTKFGFLSKGNPDAILCSLPPLVKW